MDVVEAIETRRSIRTYTKDPVSDDELEPLLRAAMCAPSAANAQPWHFIVIRDRKILDEIPQIVSTAQMVRNAPSAIAVCADTTLEKYHGFWVQDCSAATQNLLLAATARGLGAVWIGVHPLEDRVRGVRHLLKLPENVVPLCLISLGHPAEQPRRDERYKGSRIHRDTW